MKKDDARAIFIDNCEWIATAVGGDSGAAYFGFTSFSVMRSLSPMASYLA